MADDARLEGLRDNNVSLNGLVPSSCASCDIALANIRRYAALLQCGCPPAKDVHYSGDCEKHSISFAADYDAYRKYFVWSIIGRVRESDDD